MKEYFILKSCIEKDDNLLIFVVDKLLFST